MDHGLAGGDDMKENPLYRVYFSVFVVLLILSFHGVTYIPYWNFYGLDLHNLHAFHNRCAGWPVPYEKWGKQCGDVLNRSMIYPPLAYWSMGWLRGMDFNRAVLYWNFLIVLFTCIGTAFVAMAEEARTKPLPKWIWMVWILLLPQLPMVYAVERGNMDAMVIPIYCLGAYAYHRKRYFFSGALLATACWLKVYPAVPSLLLFAALIGDPELRRTVFRKFLFGFSVGALFWTAVLFPDSFRYVFEVLPQLTKDPGGYGTSSHTLYTGWTGVAVKLPLLGFWAYFSSRLLRRDPIFVFTAGLAISTFFQNLSNDYNLITTYPFLFVVLHRLLRREMNARDFGFLILTFLAFVGDRTPMEAIFRNRGALFTQLVWFAFFPLYVLNRIDKGTWIEGSLSPR